MLCFAQKRTFLFHGCYPYLLTCSLFLLSAFSLQVLRLRLSYPPTLGTAMQSYLTREHFLENLQLGSPGLNHALQLHTASFLL